MTAPTAPSTTSSHAVEPTDADREVVQNIISAALSLDPTRKPPAHFIAEYRRAITAQLAAANARIAELEAELATARDRVDVCRESRDDAHNQAAERLRKEMATVRAELAIEATALRACGTFLLAAKTELHLHDLPQDTAKMLRERLEQVRASVEGAISPNSRRQLLKLECEVQELERKLAAANAEHEQTKHQLDLMTDRHGKVEELEQELGRVKQGDAAAQEYIHQLEVRNLEESQSRLRDIAEARERESRLAERLRESEAIIASVFNREFIAKTLHNLTGGPQDESWEEANGSERAWPYRIADGLLKKLTKSKSDAARTVASH